MPIKALRKRRRSVKILVALLVDPLLGVSERFGIIGEGDAAIDAPGEIHEAPRHCGLGTTVTVGDGDGTFVAIGAGEVAGAGLVVVFVVLVVVFVAVAEQISPT